MFKSFLTLVLTFRIMFKLLHQQRYVTQSQYNNTVMYSIDAKTSDCDFVKLKSTSNILIYDISTYQLFKMIWIFFLLSLKNGFYFTYKKFFFQNPNKLDRLSNNLSYRNTTSDNKSFDIFRLFYATKTNPILIVFNMWKRFLSTIFWHPK